VYAWGMAKAGQKLKIYSVAQINELVKSAITEILPPKLTVTGEITGWKQHRSGHCYFSLKDADSVLPCVMWGSNFRKVKFEPDNGSAVLASGYVDVYMPQGKYQLYVDKLEPQGVGRLQVIFEQMVKRLTEEGLFDDEHKKPLPRYPQRIGILTSDSGAALADIVDSIFVRWPAAKMYFQIGRASCRERV
jgi:exodeoxyribonuclease VII large subunit